MDVTEYAKGFHTDNSPFPQQNFDFVTLLRAWHQYYRKKSRVCAVYICFIVVFLELNVFFLPSFNSANKKNNKKPFKYVSSLPERETNKCSYV